MNIRDMRIMLGDTQSEFASRYGVPFRTIQNWESGIRTPPSYVLDLLGQRIREDLVNRKTAVLPKRDPGKKDLPERTAFIGAREWLKAVRSSIGEDVVFALDEALICNGYFGGRNDEYLVWIYGPASAAQFNGVVIIGEHISDQSIIRKDGLIYTDMSRTVNDALANEPILDMQGITESLSRYYYSNGESFRGLGIAPGYQDRFDELAAEAIEYYDS